ncbi:MAG: hypothetical protein F4X01_02565 [Nitrospira sp. SB0661_bin_20]|nr:hypothetical protein [Nitrospira sp. SB0661_bin_20]MYJ23334.1 hypothetical protein [Nitrospira sp. SB0673_bin_12]
MPTLSDLFTPRVAKSHGYDKYESGAIAFVSNGLSDNGVVGYVTPKKRDRIFKSLALCISAFCEATVQEPPFIARGNGGSGLVVLQPKKPLSKRQLLRIAAYINHSLRWRFSFGRMVIPDRIMGLKVPLPRDSSKGITVEDILPHPNPRKPVRRQHTTMRLVPVALTDLFHIQSGDYHKADDLPDGEIPLISCGDTDNGLVRYCDVPEDHIYQNCLTVAYNGAPMTTKYHPYRFAAKDDVAVLFPKKRMVRTTIIFIQAILSCETWRYSYGRKCFKEKLSNVSIPLPMRKEKLDEDFMKSVAEETSYWEFLKMRIHDAVPPNQIEKS